MYRTLLNRQASGQSIVLIAVMLLVLIGFIGLSVDVGNAYWRQRRIQSAVNAAALAGFSAVQYPKTHSAVRGDIVKALYGHGVDASNTGRYTWSASYTFSDNTTKPIPNTAVRADNDIVRVDVTAVEQVETYFARLMGFLTLPAKAAGQACGFGVSSNFYPLGLPRDLLVNVHPEFRWRDSAKTHLDSVPYASWQTTAKRWAFNSAPGSATTFGSGSIFQIFVASGSQKLVWLTFNAAGSSGTSEFEVQLKNPGTYSIGPCTSGAAPGCYQESPPPSPLPAGSLAGGPHQADGQITVGDWMRGKTGVSFTSGIQTVLNEHIARGTVMVVPLTGPPSGTGTNTVFQATDVRQFRFVAACYGSNNFYGAVGGLVCDNTVNSYLVFEYLGAPAATAVQCVPATTPPRQ